MFDKKIEISNVESINDQEGGINDDDKNTKKIINLGGMTPNA